MPRRAQNPHNVLTRLRRQLSTPDHVVTREELAQRTGIPLGSIKALESGRYRLTNELALRVSLAVPVNPTDLFKSADPLRDFTGRPLSADSKRLEELQAPYISERPGFETDQFVARVAFEAAEKKLAGMQFRFLFREALTETTKLLGLDSIVAEELSKHMKEFDPAQVVSQMRPPQGESAKRWETYETLLRMEEDRLWMERQDQEPAFQITPEMTEEEKQRLSWESVKFEAELRIEALANVAKKAADSR
jgi:transcriptional regulator with XRE-family HTH domain